MSSVRAWKQNLTRRAVATPPFRFINMVLGGVLRHYPDNVID